MADNKALFLNLTTGRVTRQGDGDTLVAGAGVKAAGNANLVLSPGGTGTDVQLAANANLSGATGTGGVDFSGMSGTFDTPTGVALFNGTTNTFTNGVLADTLDAATATTLTIGAATATQIDIGAIGVQTFILGDLTVNGAETVVGTTEFQADVEFQGNVTFGNAATDEIEFIGVVGTSGNPNLVFEKELAHVIKVDASTTTDAAGGALTIQSGNGNGTGASGALIIDTGTGAGNRALYLGATNAKEIVLGRAAATVTLDGSTVDITGTGAVSLDGDTIDLQTANSTRLAITDAALTVQAGVTLATTSTGNINLPNNVNARFQVEGTGVGSTVTAPNLDTLTDGSNADALHTHGSAGVAKTAGENIAAGAPVILANDAGTPKWYQGEADVVGKTYPVGLAPTAITSGNPGTVALSGEVSVPDARWDSVPAVGDVGKPCFMSETNGKLTMSVASFASGSVAVKIGIISVGGTGAVKVVVQVGDGQVV